MITNLDFLIDNRANIAYLKAFNAKSFDKIRNEKIIELLQSAFLCFLIIALSVKLNEIVLLGLTVLYLLIRIAIFSEQRRPLLNTAASLPEKKTLITLDDDGLHEVVDGVVSFAPWECVKGYRVVDGVIVIRLSSGQFAVIAAHGLNKDAGEIEDVYEWLSRMKIPLI